MSDDQQPPVEDSAAIESAPEQGLAPDAPQPDVAALEQRLKDTQAWAHELSEYKQKWDAVSDPETRAEVLAELGLELEADEELPDEYEDPYETLAQRVERLETEKQQATQQAEEQARQDAVSDFIIAEVEKLQQGSGEELSDFEWRVVAQEAQRLQAEQNARAPMVQEAWDALHGVYDQRLSKAFKGKPNRGRPPQGQSASKQPDLSTREGRLSHATERLQALHDD